MPRRLSYAAVAVLHALANGHAYGFDIIDATDLPSASVYPTLGKLEDAGFVSSFWEPAAVAQRSKRPPRRYYELRPAGRVALEAALDRFRALRPLGRAPLARPRKS
jgi:DNA-binding PadR family transcriptional regulator